MKFRFLFLCLLLLIPTLALAQDDLVGLTGTYVYEGGEGDSAYTGELTLTGTGPIYWLTYRDDHGADGLDEDSALAIAQGSMVVAAFGEDCSPATLIRQSDGTLFSTWRDTSSNAVSALGLEYDLPRSETTGFAGIYDAVGSYADGKQYTASVTITENEGGWYDVRYVYESDEGTLDDLGDDFGVGLVSGNVMAFAYTSDDSPCEPYLIDLSDGAFTSYHRDAAGRIVVESGSRAE